MANYYFSVRNVERDGGLTSGIISVGIVTDDDRSFYAVNYENQHLDVQKTTSTVILSPLDLRLYISLFVGLTTKPWFVGFKPAYPWVSLCSLFGGIGSLPKRWPDHCMDAYQRALMIGGRTAIEGDTALDEARWVRRSWAMMDRMQVSQGGYADAAVTVEANGVSGSSFSGRVSL